MSGQAGQAFSASLVPGIPQTRVCQCARPAAFADDHGMCCKCGYRAEPEPPSRTGAWAHHRYTVPTVNPYHVPRP